MLYTGVNAGDLRNQIQIVNTTGIQDSFGQESEAYNVVYTVWASIELLRGRELWSAKQFLDTISTRICIRYKEGIIPKMCVKCKNRFFKIEAVIDVENRHRELQLMCEELVYNDQ